MRLFPSLTDRFPALNKGNKKPLYSLRKKALAVEAPRFGKGSGAKEDSSPASRLILL
jgi:hypothetical protein